MYTLTETIPAAPTGNATWQPRLCDQLLRFDSQEQADSALRPIRVSPPIISVTTYTSAYLITPTRTTTAVTPSCSASNDEECANIWKLFATSLSNSLYTWSSDNILTISIASPPTAIVVNGKATPLTAAQGSFPTITVHDEVYPDDRGTYHITGALNFRGETYLTPGGRLVLTWNYDDQTSRPFGPNGCQRPTGTVIKSLCDIEECTVDARSFELLYFAPPSTSRDLCANTSPGYNSCE